MNHPTTLEPSLGALLSARPAFPGEVQNPGDAASSEAEWNRKFGEEARPIRDGRDLLIAVGDFLATLGLEPDLKAVSLTFLFMGRRHRLALVDLDHDAEETLRGQGFRDLMADGLPFG